MLGLLEPTAGEILIDGVPLATVGARAYRENVGAVMQEDQLLSGSIADNICFFDAIYDQNRMIECAQIAGIHDEIMAMPMTYNSLIGDMGSSLSGGQKQRVLLARALYRQPKLLFLDEGTAHLDVPREAEINANLRRLGMTLISVAHRPGAASGADYSFHVARTCEPIEPRKAPEEIAPTRDRDPLNRPSRRDKKSPLPMNGRGLFFLMNGGAAGVAAAAGQCEADRRALRRFEALRPVVLDDDAVQREAAIARPGLRPPIDIIR